MNKKILTLLFIVFSSFLYAQYDFAPTGAKWHYQSGMSIFHTGYRYLTMENIGDTIIQNKTCKHIEITEYGQNSSTGDNSYWEDEFWYVKEDTVWRLADNDTFYILHNFDAEIGDSWTTRLNGGYSNDPEEEFTIVVDSLKMVNINGFNLRQYKYSFIYNDEFSCSPYYSQDGTITEIIGGSEYYKPLCYGFLDFDIRDGLRCYSDPNFGEYKRTSQIECDETSVNNNNIQTRKINIHPNPSSGIFYLENIEEINQIEVYDINGRLIQTLLKKNLSKSFFEIEEKGLFFIKIYDSKNISLTKKVVVN